MSVALCIVAMAIGTHCDRGGHAETVPPARGGAAVALELPVRLLKRFTSWICIHEHEGAWNDRGDPYWGGLQMDRGFMRTYGRDMLLRHHGGLADVWTPAEQITVAERAYATRGFAPWPNTSRACGVR